MFLGNLHRQYGAWATILATISMGLTGCRTTAAPPSILSGEWRTEGGNFHRTGSVHPGLSPPLEESWRVRAGRGIRGSPVPAGSVVIVATTDGKIKAFRMTDGKKTWETKIRGGCFSAPILSEGRLFVTTEYPDGTLYCLALDKGDLLWEQPIGPSRSTPSIDGGTLYTVTNAGEVLAHEGDSGDLRWSSSIGSLVPQSPLVENDSVFVLCRGDTLKVLSTADGTVWKTRSTPPLLYPLTSRAEGGLRFSSRSGFGPSSPSSPENLPNSGTLPVYRFAASEGRLLATDGVRTVYAADAHSGQILWSRDTSGLLDASPCIAGELGIIVSLAGEILLLDISTGLPLWTVQVDAPLSPSPAVSGEWLFVVTDRGELIAFASGSGRERSQKETE